MKRKVSELPIDDFKKTFPIAVVSHGAMINQLYHSFLSLPVSSNIHIATGDTGIHLWHYNSKDRYIMFSNKTEHCKII